MTRLSVRLVRSSASPIAVLAALTLGGGCGGASVQVVNDERGSDADQIPSPTSVGQDPPEFSVASFRGHVSLGVEIPDLPPEGDVHQHVFLVDGEPYEGMCCYADADTCLVFDRDGGSPDAAEFIGHLVGTAEPPFVFYFDREGEGDAGGSLTWANTTALQMRVVYPGRGEIDRSRLVRDDTLEPPPGVAAVQRASVRLSRIFHALQEAYNYPAMGGRQLPTPRDLAPATVPCGPTVVDDPEALQWLGLEPPAVLSWSYGLEVDEETRGVRVIAARRPSCGSSETEILEVDGQVDELGDLVRTHDADAPGLEPHGSHEER